MNSNKTVIIIISLSLILLISSSISAGLGYYYYYYTTTTTTTTPTSTTPATASGCGSYTYVNELTPGQSLSVCNGIKSNNNRYKFVMQKDGNGVLINEQTRGQIFTTGTANNKNNVFRYLSDGTLIVNDPDGMPLWTSEKSGNTKVRGVGTNLVLQDDGNLVKYNGSKAYWATDLFG